jgi:general secretion pathway protein G
MNADIATAHQVKAALDRYQAENGEYPLGAEMSAADGKVTADKLIPQYISKLDSTVTQQRAEDTNKGFGLESLATGAAIPTTPTNLIMIYLRTDGSDAEVRAYDKELKLIWPAEPEPAEAT